MALAYSGFLVIVNCRIGSLETCFKVGQRGGKRKLPNRQFRNSDDLVRLLLNRKLPNRQFRNLKRGKEVVDIE